MAFRKTAGKVQSGGGFMKTINVGNFRVGKGEDLLFISGPCVIEDESLAMKTGEALTEMCEKFPVSFVYKSSFDKANRSSVESYRGPGIEKGLEILRKVKENFGVPIMTDIHTPEQAAAAADVADLIQVPAFLCRQTDLVVAAGKTGKAVNLKKGQFMAPWDLEQVIKKIESTGNTDILLTDRGVMFGYNNLVSDMRAIPLMQQLGYPACFDGTHSGQLPGSLGTCTGGQRDLIPTLVRASIAAGANALYLESHPEPETAPCDSTTMLSLASLPQLLEEVVQIYAIAQAVPA